MATAVAALPLLRHRARIQAKPRKRHFPIENTIIFGLALAFYIALANYIVFHLHYQNGDAYARIDNAFDVLFTSDPHLGAIGFFWPPLPSFLDLPIIAFRGFWPALVVQGFAGAIEASIFSAGTVVLFNSGLKWAGVVRGMRWVLCAVWMINPMTVIYAAQGMSEALFVFFFVASILVFLRWAESGRGALLPLMGILVGLDCLCRVEAFFLAFAMGVGVIVMSIRRLEPGGWRRVETEALMFGLPVLLMVGLWLGSAGVLLRDFLYPFHAGGFTGHASIPQSAAPSGGSGGGGATGIPSIWADAFTYVATHCIALFPAVIALLLLMIPRFLVQKNRIPTVLVVALGLSIPALDVVLRTGALGPQLGSQLRYQISIIPFTFILAVYLLRSLKARFQIYSSMLALALTVVLGLSNVGTAITLGLPNIAQEEAPLVAAIAGGQTVPDVTGVPDPASYGAQITQQILALDTDGGRILCDSRTCFSIVLNAPNPYLFVVTSDRIFEASAAQPKVYNVEYFLAANPQFGQGGIDRLNMLYPSLYEDGAGFATRVGEAGGYRLYRIVGPTGRG